MLKGEEMSSRSVRDLSVINYCSPDITRRYLDSEFRFFFFFFYTFFDEESTRFSVVGVVRLEFSRFEKKEKKIKSPNQIECKLDFARVATSAGRTASNILGSKRVQSPLIESRIRITIAPERLNRQSADCRRIN